jgi:phospholipase C
MPRFVLPRLRSMALLGAIPLLSVHAAGLAQTATPIEHIVVIFQENVSFDHYFATYPTALNPSGGPAFHAAGSTPKRHDRLRPLEPG